MGKGSINKKCEYDDGSPIVGAEVWIEEIATSQWTDAWGWANFSNLDSGLYTIYVDMDVPNDGVWDGVPDYIYLGEGEVVNITNDFPLPLKKQKLE